MKTPEKSGKPSRAGGNERFNKNHERFIEALGETGDLRKAYMQAGYQAKTPKIALQNANRLLRVLEKKMDYREIIANVGLTGHKIAQRLLDAVDHEDPHVSVKGLNLVTRCVQWQQPSLAIGIGVEINISGVQAQAQAQAQDDTIDVTSSALDELPLEEEQVAD